MIKVRSGDVPCADAMSVDTPEHETTDSSMTRRVAVRAILVCVVGGVVAVESGCLVVAAGKAVSTAGHTTGRVVFGSKKKREKRRERRLAKRKAREDAEAAEREDAEKAEEPDEGEEQR